MDKCPMCEGSCERFRLICDRCEETMNSGLEEYSVMAQAMMSKKYPLPDTDPWS